MPQVIPKLNLNKHPSEVSNGGVINAMNMMVSNDNAVIQTEPIISSSAINDKLVSLIGNNVLYEIKSVISCNKELILFIVTDASSATIDIYRYNEELDSVKYVTTTDYHNGTIIGTFTYNNNNLIIAFSEYFEDDNNSIPLKVINLGTFDKISSQNENQLEKSVLHSICPEVNVPKVRINYIDGSANKGWYYIFIRYKISEDTYTQWFDTNAHALVDSFNGTRFFSQYISKDAPGDRNPKGIFISYAETYVSDDTDVSKISFNCNVNDKDTNYDYYQLGFICVNKSTTKAYRTNDILIDINQFTFSHNSVVEISAVDIINTYNNYYNVKTLTTVNNRLYIANYKEHSIENEVKDKLSNIHLSITQINTNVDLNLYDYNPEQIIAEYTTNDYNLRRVCNLHEDGFYYYNAVGAIVQNMKMSGLKYEFVTLSDIDEDSTITITYGSKTEQIYAKDLIIAPFYQFQDSLTNTRYGKVFVNRNGVLDDITPNGCPDTVVYINASGSGSTSDKYGVMVQDNSKSSDSVPGLVKINTFAVSNSSNVIKELNTVGIYPGQYYNFFVHFIDKYGQISNGFNISNFNVNTTIEKGYNKLNNLLLYIPVPNNTGSTGDNFKVTLRFNLTSVPDGVKGYFISYEKLEKAIKLNGVTDVNDKGEICFYTDELNFADSIDFNFNKLRVYNSFAVVNNNYVNKKVFDQTKYLYKYNDDYEDITITNKEIRAADSFNNVLSSTCIVLTLGERESSITEKIASLILDDAYNFYNNEVKTLIPCSDINYNLYSNLIVNTQTAFVSLNHAIVFNNVYYNDAIKIFQEENSVDAQYKVLTNYIWYGYSEVPVETLKFNNNPVTTFFPIEGLNTENENKKTFIVGNIVECKNTVDLYQQNNTTVDSNYPKSLDWYNPNNTYENNYTKTIRRSNILQDESHTNSWREFSLEQYKIITENKGDIIKLISIGYYFIVHTQHSMFLFNSTNSIKSNEDSNLQLSSVDIWDIDYKEVITSQLGYAGIQKEYSGIIGNFGYIFYDADARRFYKYDNNNITYIDDDINNFVNKLIGYNVHFTDDKKRNRLLICFIKDNQEDIVLSYNYRTNTFVSLHSYRYNRGYNTKENIYLISKYDGTKKSEINVYSDNTFNNAYIEVMLNANYYMMKYIESLIYKVQIVTPVAANNYSPVEGTFDLYAADFLRVYNVHCDTKDIDVTFDNAANEVNVVMNYTKPYWRFGNWHFNALRNNLVPYINKEHIAEECSRIFGHWFVVKFTFNKEQQVEIEYVDGNFINAESI